MILRVKYKDTEHFIEAHHVHTWKPTDPEIAQGYTLGSSGPKDYTRNRIVTAFAQTQAEFSRRMKRYWAHRRRQAA